MCGVQQLVDHAGKCFEVWIGGGFVHALGQITIGGTGDDLFHVALKRLKGRHAGTFRGGGGFALGSG